MLNNTIRNNVFVECVLSVALIIIAYNICHNNNIASSPSQTQDPEIGKSVAVVGNAGIIYTVTSHDTTGWLAAVCRVPVPTTWYSYKYLLLSRLLVRLVAPTRLVFTHVNEHPNPEIVTCTHACH